MSRVAKRKERINAFREEDDDDDLNAESMAEAKTQQLLRGSTYLAMHAEFLRFCQLYLLTEPAQVCGPRLLPKISVIRHFSFYLASIRKGISGDRPRVRSIVGWVYAEMRVLQSLSGLEWQRPEVKQIFCFIRMNLRKMFSLNTREKEKPTATFEDFKIIVSHVASSQFLSTITNMREALNVLLFLNLYIDTGAKGVDLLVDKNNVNDTGLKWQNCKFFSLRSEFDPSKVLLAVEVNYIITKSTKASRRLKPSLVIEIPEAPLAFDSTALLFIAATLAGVFPSHVTWESLHHKPSENRVQEIWTNPTKSNDYVFANTFEFQTEIHGSYDMARMRTNISGIGVALGFVDPLQPYALRRMVGNTAEKDVNISEMQRRQIMGHNAGSKIFDQNYLDKLLQLDVQQIIRQLPEDRHFLEGISGYCARRVSVEQHYLAVESFVNQQKDVILLRSKLAEIRATYNSKYGNVNFAKKAEPSLVLEAERLEDNITIALKKHRTQISKTLRHEAFEGRFRSMLESTGSLQSETALSNKNPKASGIETVEGHHISEWLHQIDDRPASIRAAIWFFARPHRINRFYPGMTCTVDAKCPVCLMNMKDIPNQNQAAHRLNCASHNFAGNLMEKPLQFVRMIPSVSYCYICHTMIWTSEWNMHCHGHLDEVRLKVSQLGYNSVLVRFRNEWPGICPFCLEEGLVKQQNGTSLAAHIHSHLRQLERDDLMSKCPCGDLDKSMSWNEVRDHLIDGHDIRLAAHTIEKSVKTLLEAAAPQNVQEVETVRDRPTLPDDAPAPMDVPPHYFPSETLFASKEFPNCPVRIFRMRTSNLSSAYPTRSQIMPQYSDIELQFQGLDV